MKKYINLVVDVGMEKCFLLPWFDFVLAYFVFPPSIFCMDKLLG